jgi:peptide deformylase
VFEISLYGDPVLRKTAVPVEMFDEKLKRFVEEMTETMRTKDGVGLAAPQVGVSISLVVIDITAGESAPLVFINPVVYNLSEELLTTEEGCLSLPGITLKVTRPAKVSVKALDVNGNEFVIENAEGLLAKAIQHETDHLRGIMIIDHISALQKTMLGNKLKKIIKSARDKFQKV